MGCPAFTLVLGSRKRRCAALLNTPPLAIHPERSQDRKHYSDWKASAKLRFSSISNDREHLALRFTQESAHIKDKTGREARQHLGLWSTLGSMHEQPAEFSHNDWQAIVYMCYMNYVAHVYVLDCGDIYVQPCCIRRATCMIEVL